MEIFTYHLSLLKIYYPNKTFGTNQSTLSLYCQWQCWRGKCLLSSCIPISHLSCSY